MVYDGFISYHRDTDDSVAARLQSELERFARPWYRTRRLRIFRDKTDLSAGSQLWSVIERALGDSRWLILLASPASAQSEWVRREVTWWLVNRGSADRILLVHTAGTIAWSGDDFDWGRTDALPRVLAGRFAEEPHWLDARALRDRPGGPRFGDAIADLSAPILMVESKEQLVGEHARHRRRFRRFVALVSVLLLASTGSAVAAGVVAQRRADAAHRALLAQTATRVADTARELAPGDADGTALLLAMVSDDLAAQVGEETRVFETLARDSATTLIQIVRPEHGRFRQVALSPGGALGLVATDEGTATIVSTARGEVLWTQQFGSGFQMSPNHVSLGAVALANGDLAALATSDGEVVLVRRRDGVWGTAEHVDVSTLLRSSSGPLWTETMAFAPNGAQLAAASDDGVIIIDLQRDLPQARACSGPVNATAMRFLADSELLVTQPDGVLAIDPRTCSVTQLLAAPAGVVLGDAIRNDTGELLALGTQGNDLVMARPVGDAVRVAERGPYEGPVFAASEIGLIASAHGRFGTYGWLVSSRRQVFGLQASGTILLAKSRMLFLHDGRLEVHTTDSATPMLTVGDLIVPGVGMYTGWAGPDLVAARTPYGPIYLFRDARHGLSPDPQTYQLLDKPDEQSVIAIATQPDGHNAIGIFQRRDENDHQLRTDVAWDTATGKVVPLTGSHDNGVDAVFLHERLYVARTGGLLEAYSRGADGWAVVASTTLPRNIVSLDALDRTLVVAIADNIDGDLSIVRLDPDTLESIAIRDLSGPAGVIRIAALPDGRSVVAYGTGEAVLLGSELAVEWDVPNLAGNYVIGVYPVPGEPHVVIGLNNESVTLDIDSHVRVTNSRFGYAATLRGASATADGLYFAGWDFLDSHLRIWTLDPRQIRQRACAAISRDITAEEWAQYVGPDISYFPVCSGTS